jgi:hypothetical protein
MIRDQTRREAEVAGKLPQALEQKLDPSKLVIPKMPDLRIDTADFNDPWHAHSNAKGKGRASEHGDDISDSGFNFDEDEDEEWETQGNGEHDSTASGFGDDHYEDGVASIPPPSGLHSRNPSVEPLDQSPALESATLDPPNGQYLIDLQSTLGRPASLQPPPTSRQGSVQPSGRQGSVQPHVPPSRQGSVQPHLPPSRQGSVQPHLPPSRQGSVQPQLHHSQSRQGSVNPLSHAMDEQSHTNARASKKRPYASVGDSYGPKPKRKARKAPHTPVRPLRKIAGPSTGTRSQGHRKNPMIVSTDATPVSGSHRVTALYVADGPENEDA